MAVEGLDPRVEHLLGGLRQLQAEFGEEIADVEQESPAAALESLEDAVAQAPKDYRPYLQEALECYQHGLYRASILMVWAAVMQHLYSVAGSHRGGVSEFQKANKLRFGNAKRKYREIKKQDDFLYLGERDFIQLGEDAGMLNRNARKVLHERLELRNLCGHPTQYRPGREETVIFIESLVLNVLTGSWLNW
jgi:hypothetical protein